MDRVKYLNLLNKKLKLGLDIRGNLVYANGAIMNPFALEKVINLAFEKAKEMMLKEMVEKWLNESEDYSRFDSSAREENYNI